jgi:polyhydroxyalkanoate synthesis repressor PhaR
LITHAAGSVRRRPRRFSRRAAARKRRRSRRCSKLPCFGYNLPHIPRAGAGRTAPQQPGHEYMGDPSMPAVRLIKKYPNRRLYDTQTSSYITLADVKQLVLDQEEFKVVDAKSSEDLTRQILMQIILEEEQEGQPMFTPPVLSQIIRSYGNAMQGMMGSYLEKNVQAFVDIQNKLQEQSKAFYDSNKVGPEMWSQFVNMQGPMLQSMMSSYIEQSKDLFMQMQENMSKQARSMFTGFQFPPEKK